MITISFQRTVHKSRRIIEKTLPESLFENFFQLSSFPPLNNEIIYNPINKFSTVWIINNSWRNGEQLQWFLQIYFLLFDFKVFFSRILTWFAIDISVGKMIFPHSADPIKSFPNNYLSYSTFSLINFTSTSLKARKVRRKSQRKRKFFLESFPCFRKIWPTLTIFIN